MTRAVVGLVYTSRYLCLLVLTFCFGWMVNYDDFPSHLLSAGSRAQMYLLSAVAILL
jgi:hypothetical protein